MEENLRRSLLISNGSWDFLWSRPLTASIIAVTISIVSWQIYKTIKNQKV
jgi:putative tricarboxylic transport membrane protein